MLTLNCLVRKKVDISTEDFRNYWMGERYEMELPVLSQLGVKKYTICETQHEDPVNKQLQEIYCTPSDSYDFVNHLAINDLEDFKKGLTDSAVQTVLKALGNADAKYVDLTRSNLWFTVDIPQLFPREDYEANWSNTYLKVIYVGTRRPNFSLAQAQLHWLSCHGSLARQYKKFLPFDKYIQCHLLESKLLNRVKQELGFTEDMSRIIGQAELWIDRRILPTLAGPDVEYMMGMLLEDISLMGEAKDGRIFACKEYVKHSEPIITRPLPILTSGD